MNPFRYLLRAIGFSWLAYGRPSLRRIGILAGRALGGWLAYAFLPRRR